MSSNERKKQGSPSPHGNKRSFSFPRFRNKGKAANRIETEETTHDVITASIPPTPAIEDNHVQELKPGKDHITSPVKPSHKKSSGKGSRKKNAKDKAEYYNKLSPTKKQPGLPALVENNVGKSQSILESNSRSVEKAETRQPSSDNELREKAATKIQARYRGHVERKKYLRQIRNVIKAEALARGFLARKHVSQMRREVSPQPDDSIKA